MKKISQSGDLRFESKSFGTFVSLSPEVVEHFAAFRQQGKIRAEIGGQLFAQFSKDEVRIKRASGPNSVDKHGWNWFRPDRRNQNAEIKRFFAEGFHFVGDWHTHPENTPVPSTWDFESMEDSFKKSRHQLKGFVMVIVGRAAFPEGLWVSLHNRTTWERLVLSRNEDSTVSTMPTAKNYGR